MDYQQTQCSRACSHSCKMLWIHFGFGEIIPFFIFLVLFVTEFPLFRCWSYCVRHHPPECQFVVNGFNIAHETVCILQICTLYAQTHTHTDEKENFSQRTRFQLKLSMFDRNCTFGEVYLSQYVLNEQNWFYFYM